MDIQTMLLIATSVISGASIVLRVVAPITKTKKDDKVLKVLLQLLKFLSAHTPMDDEIKVVVKNK